MRITQQKSSTGAARNVHLNVLLSRTKFNRDSSTRPKIYPLAVKRHLGEVSIEIDTDPVDDPDTGIDDRLHVW